LTETRTLVNFPWNEYHHETRPEVCALDDRHILLLHNLIHTHRPKHCLEIGCHKGYSTQVFLIALKYDLIESLTLVDVRFTQELLRLVHLNPTTSTRTILTQQDSRTFVKDNQRRFDLAFIDGNHRPEYVTPEVDHFIQAETPIICLHDTNLSNLPLPHTDQTGPLRAKNTLQGTPPYLCLEDNQRRPGEATERGFLTAFRDLDRLEQSRPHFRQATNLTRAELRPR